MFDGHTDIVTKKLKFVVIVCVRFVVVCVYVFEG